MSIKLNLGCGNKPLPLSDLWLNVDMNVPPDSSDFKYLAADVTTLDGVEDNSASEILASHIIEHIHPKKVDSTLKRWHTILKPGGRIALELPDLIKCCINVLQLETSNVEDLHTQMGLWGLYGNSEREGDGMAHQWGYSFNSLSQHLSKAGFRNIERTTPVMKPLGVGIRDMRVEALK